MKAWLAEDIGKQAFFAVLEEEKMKAQSEKGLQGQHADRVGNMPLQ